MSDLIRRSDAIEEIARRDTTDGTVKVFSGREVADILHNLPSAPHVMAHEEVAEMLSNIFDECACNVNGNDEWLPQSCKYAETECPSPKEKNGCWMQFLIQGGADMRGDESEWLNQQTGGD